MSFPAIAFTNVSFSYGATKILRHVDFAVCCGEMIGIVGPNGEGKTTALKLAMGFLEPSEGTILLNGLTPKGARPHIGYVPQVHPYDRQFPISTLDVILTGGISHSNWLGRFSQQVKQRAYQLMDDLHITPLASRPFGSLSGGQAQKVLLARALVSDPTTLFLDEPTAHIDAQSEEAIFSFLQTFAKTKTIITVTHNFDAILRYMDRVLCFQKQVVSLKPNQVCKHFALGMYHPPEYPS